MYKLPDSYLALDTETNGLPKKEDYSEVEVTEIGWVSIFNREVAGEENYLCKPVDKDGNQVPQTAKIIEVTGLTDEMLVDQPPTIEVMEKILPDIISSPLSLVGSNIIGFDKHLLDKYCDMLGFERIADERYVDTAALFKSYRRAHVEGNTDWEVPESQEKFYLWAKSVLAFSWQKDKVKFNVDAALGYLAIPMFGVTGDRHRAVFDSKLCHLILEKLREEMSL